MKRFHLILILLFAAMCAVLLWQGRALHEEEATLRIEASRVAGTPSMPEQGRAAPDSAARRPTRPTASDFDPDLYLAEVRKLIENHDPTDRHADGTIRMFLFNHKDRIAAAPSARLKEVCEKLAEDGLDEVEGLIWGTLVQEITRSDPAWAINRIAEYISTKVEEAPQKRVLLEIGKGGSFGSQSWSPAYAAALDEWLDQAQAEGRLDGLEAQVAPLRFDTALATGDFVGAVARLGQLSPDDQAKRAGDLAAAAHESGQSRRLIEEVSTAAHPAAFENFARELSRRSGFENAQAALAAAKLPPENHDLAAAGIAAANIGPDTPDRAQWLLESLQADTPFAVNHFAAAWTSKDHKGAGEWLTGLAPGPARDAAIAGFAPRAAGLDGASAVEWALAIAEPAQRSATLDLVYQTWRQRDPEAAAAYLREKGIYTSPE